MINITRTSPLSGVTRTIVLNITLEQMNLHNAGMYIQDAFPNLTPGEREFYLTGISEEEWDAAFGDEE